MAGDVKVWSANWWSVILPYVAVFVAALAARVWFNLYAGHINCYATADAWEYLHNGQALANLSHLPSAGFWREVVTAIVGGAQSTAWTSVKAQLQPVYALLTSGPVYPLYLAFTYWIAGQQYNVANWIPPVLNQAFISALTCVLITAIGSAAWSRRVGVLAGLIAAFYPGFIVNSNRLVTETVACFLLAAVVWLTVRGVQQGRFRAWELLALGASTAALQLSRSLMILVSLTLVPLAVLRNRRTTLLRSVVLVAAGFVLTVAPWMAFKTVLTGDTSLVVDRLSHYNFVIGNDYYNLGWLAVPYPEVYQAEKKSFTTLASQAFSNSPAGFVRLVVDKLPRMFKLPWNDFRADIWPINPYWQTVIHQLILLLAACGVVLSVFLGDSAAPPARRQLISRLVVCWVVLVHLPYMAFVTLPRYVLTAMPYVILLAAAGLDTVVGLLLLGRLPDTVNLNRCDDRGTGVGADCIRPEGACNAPLHSAGEMSDTGDIGGGDNRMGGLGAAHTARLNAPLHSASLRRCTPWMVLLFGLIFFVLSKETLLPHILALSKIRNATICCTADCFLRCLSMIAFVGALISCRKLLCGNRRAALLVACALGAVLLVADCITTRAHGRWYEWEAMLNKPGQTARETICLDEVAAKAGSMRQCYLMIDGAGWQQLFAGTTIKVCGRTLHGPVIPSLSLVDCLFWYEPAEGGKISRRYESIFGALVAATGLANTDLRQWFLVPIPPDLLNNRSITVELEKTDSSPTHLFGCYPVKKGTRLIPSVNRYSWEKAFYGVENDSGLSDSRYDETTAGRSRSDFCTDDLSSAPGLQFGYYNIRLLVPAPRYMANPGMISTIRSLSLSAESNLVVAGVPYKTTVTNIPDYGRQDIWLLRYRGQVRSMGAPGEATFALTINSRGNPGQLYSYNAPWGLKLKCTPAWLPFDLAFPLKPGDIPGKLKDLEISCYSQPSATQAWSQKKDATVELRGLQLEFLKLPEMPTTFGYRVY